jgi:hypothetical protein
MLWIAKIFGRRFEWHDGKKVCIAYLLVGTMFFDKRAMSLRNGAR